MIKGNRIILSDKALSDAWDDYIWETDSELAFLDASPPLNIPFYEYLADYAAELRYPASTSRRFAVETLDGKHIGNCSYYNIDSTDSGGETELGVMIGNRNYWDKGYGTETVTTLVNHIFQTTEMNRIYLKTLETNIRAQKCFAKCGFVAYGRMSKDGFDFVLMDITRERWQEGYNKTDPLKNPA